MLKGGGAEVGQWASDHGFRLPPDAPEVLEFYASRSPIFLAARFDADAARARGQQVGEGTPVHITIPTDNPWVPLRILSLGKPAAERIQADVYLLTDGRPTFVPGQFLGRGLNLLADRAASTSLLADLHSDKGMDWVPTSGMWLSYAQVNARAGQLTYDLAADVHGQLPTATKAGTAVAVSTPSSSGGLGPWLVIGAMSVLVVGVAVVATAAYRRVG